MCELEASHPPLQNNAIRRGLLCRIVLAGSLPSGTTVMVRIRRIVRLYRPANPNGLTRAFASVNGQSPCA
jgi:hypothetical protein